MLRNILIFCIFLFPAYTNAQVMFSEIAWMGTDASATHEWIELYNLSSTPTDVTGWTITLNDAPFITLLGTMTPHGIAVLERSNDDVLPDTAFQIYTGALSNTGATLQLLDSAGVASDEVVSGTNWSDVGGSNVIPKMTPQRTRTGTWVTGTPTPGADNVQESALVPEGEADTSDDSDTETKTEASKPKSSGGGSSKKTIPVAERFPRILSLEFVAPKIVYVNQAVDFEAVPEGIGPTILSSLHYTWNFGDTYVDTGKRVKHSFAYPGEYIIAVEATFAKHTAVVRHEITVLPASFEISSTPRGDVVLHNKSKYEVDLGSYTMRGTSQFAFPRLTFIKAGGTLTVPKEKIGDTQRGVILSDEGYTEVASLEYTPVLALRAPSSYVQFKEPKVAQVSSLSAASEERTVTTKEDETLAEAREPQDMVIHIGATPEDTTQNGFVAGFFKKIANIFSW